MSTYIGLGSGKERGPLTRTDVEKRLELVGDGENLVLAGEDLRGSDLGGLTLLRANLSEANLSFADLSEADLTRADLTRANLTGANLTRTNLTRATLNEADLTRANLTRAFLMGADLIRATLTRAVLMGADLSRATLTRATLSEAVLMGAVLMGAFLMGADLSEADLTRANLTRANLTGADLSEADLTRTDLTRATLARATLTGTDLTKISISSTTFSLDTELLGRLALALQGSNESKKEVGPSLQLRIQEEPLTAQHLSATIDAFTSLYVKMWLLHQERFDDFVHYTEHKDRRFEEEANLLIAELKYNSPADIKFNIDLSPKAVIEALQVLIDTIIQAKPRKQLKEEEVRKERLNNADHMIETIEKAAAMVDKLYPGLDKDRREIAIRGLMKDILQLVGDQTLEISLQLPSPVPQQSNSQVDLQEQKSSVQASEKTAG